MWWGLASFSVWALGVVGPFHMEGVVGHFLNYRCENEKVC